MGPHSRVRAVAHCKNAVGADTYVWFPCLRVLQGKAVWTAPSAPTQRRTSRPIYRRPMLPASGTSRWNLQSLPLCAVRVVSEVGGQVMALVSFSLSLLCWLILKPHQGPSSQDSATLVSDFF